MMYVNPHTDLRTHQVTNQAKPLLPIPLWASDPALSEAVSLWGRDEEDALKSFASRVGECEVVEWGWQANQNPPKLHTHDRFGHRVDEVEYHPAYHQLMSIGIDSETSSAPWTERSEGSLPKTGHLKHSVQIYLLSQIESGVCCPISMTYAASSVLATAPSLRDEFQKLITPQYDPRSLPIGQKKGITMGMAMTEKQGGSDVRANQTLAIPSPSEGTDVYRLTGHKWFCSAPMSDAFLSLALVDGQVTCFFLPRWTPEGHRNHFHIQRLKNKLGNHANASSEVEFANAWAFKVGEVGAGVKTIIEMVHHTRLDAALANASIMRQAATQAIAHCTQRSAFGAKLIEQPMMRSVLADLWLETEGATWMTLYLAHCFDQARRPDGQNAKRFSRLATALIKFWVCKRTPPMVYEALECHGGAGYVEESVMPRLYREAPLNSIWEGSGNVMCLDVLRALSREPESALTLIEELKLAKGHHRLLDQKIDQLQSTLQSFSRVDSTTAMERARVLVSDLALTLQASLLTRFAPTELSEAFCAARLGQSARLYGDLSPEVNISSVLNRADPLIQAVNSL